MKGAFSAYLLANIITFVGLVAAFQVPLVTDAIAHSAYTPSEIFVGAFSILTIIYTCLFAATIRL